MANDLNFGNLKITLTTAEDEPTKADFEMPDGSVVTRFFPSSGELDMRLGLGLTLAHMVGVVGESATAPAQFQDGDWSVADKETGGTITITISTLPSDGGSAITDLEYQIDGGAWTSLGGTTTGSYDVSGLTDDVAVSVAIRAVNAVGAGTASAMKAVTPTTAAAGDPHFANVVLLAGFDGVDGSTTLTDDSNTPHALTAVGNAQIDTAQSKFGGGALLLDGTGDYVTIPDHEDWNLGAGQFTLEAWVRFAAGFGTEESILGQWAASGSSRSWFLDYNSGLLRLRLSGATVNLTGTWSAVQGVWYHVAADRDAANVVRIYVDGTMVGSTTAAFTLPNSTSNFCIGTMAGVETTAPFTGWIDEVRITKGVARYASNAGFTVPAVAYPRS